MDAAEQIKQWAKELKSVAQTGLTYGKDVFDKERYSQMHDLATTMLSYISGMSEDEVIEKLPIESGYTTPKMAVRGVVMQNGKLLMVKEAADGLWCLPGGWCDINLTPSENIEKEIEEETGLKTKAVRLIAFFDQTKKNPSVTMQHIYTVYFLCEVLSGDLKGSIETKDVGFFAVDDIPPLSSERITQEQLTIALNAVTEQNNQTVYFD
ncbi:ADP-ribose pyrophosphatase YjhB (NUDIX family) [Salirhabdus euzebyi]|uniref:ADP-ribose pyrophosphatase YjhB (NUDIX family) n=1 Tax=Salirhabdus euzebyi TaxID=394506 RepID=A0A841Q8K6_9BACI|nr:NUDIX hydrolase N-terminal domain-containing protein [Salirhabdus euzebyi]MBB6454607.1 ADP-ribose pyrophosphatase YjhB (NUDIX family) [Salirhabdus euzebyi]